MNTSELIDILLLQAKEIETEGHAGWGNTMLDAAQKLKECESAMQTFVTRVENGEVRSKKKNIFAI